MEKARQGVKIMTIAGHNMIIPKSIVTDIGPTFDKLISEGMFEARMLEDARIALYISDNKVLFMQQSLTLLLERK